MKINVLCFAFGFSQARLKEIITSENKTVPEEKPWMVDGCGVPENSCELLRELVRCYMNVVVAFRVVYESLYRY